MVLSEEFYFKPHMQLNFDEPNWRDPSVAGGWCMGLVDDWMVDALTAAKPWDGNMDSRMFVALSRQRAYHATVDGVRTVAKYQSKHPNGAAEASVWEQLMEPARRSAAAQGGQQTQYGEATDEQRLFAAALKNMQINIQAHEAFSRQTRRLKGIAWTIAYAANPADLYQRALGAVTAKRSAGLAITVGGKWRNEPMKRFQHVIGYAPWHDGGKRIIDTCSAQWRFDDGTADDQVARYIERYVARAGIKYWPGKADILCVTTYHPPGPGTGVEILTAEAIPYRSY